MILTYVVAAFAVAICCVISVIKLTKQKQEDRSRELQQARNKATMTILLFALVYGVCNVPLVIDFVIQTHTIHSDAEVQDFFEFDESSGRYYHLSRVATFIFYLI